jgi:hypothetical protein
MSAPGPDFRWVNSSFSSMWFISEFHMGLRPTPGHENWDEWEVYDQADVGRCLDKVRPFPSLIWNVTY